MSVSDRVWLQRLVAIALVGCVSLLARPVQADNSAPARITGRAMAVDGDTLDVAGLRIRMEGIDAPEIAQMCQGGWMGTWACGKTARRALEKMVRSTEVSCESKGLDKFGRHLGICFSAGKDLNAEMVRAGLAWAFVKYSKTYVAEEAAAKSAGLGIWANDTEPAWVYREKRWANAEQVAPEGCAIKGNVTDKGHIYHLPWSPWYPKVKVEPAKGERWFCSESEAITAGWRPAIVN